MVIKATMIKVLFAEMYVNVVFLIRWFVQRSEFNYRIALYKNYLLLLLYTLDNRYMSDLTCISWTTDTCQI